MMNQHLKLVLYTSLLFIFTGFSMALSKSFSLDKIEINTRIQADGHLQIQENRTYTFKGSYSWADYRLPLQGITDIRYFSLSDESETYRRDTSEEPGTYIIQEKNGEFYVRWFYRAKNESRTFTLNYLATDVITKYQDVAELYFKFVGTANDYPVQTVEVTIEFPSAANFPEVRAWAHGPLWGEVQFRNDKLRLSVSPLPARRFWEVRTVFPPAWIPTAARIIKQAQLETILQEEDAWARQANEEREKAQRRLAQRKEMEGKAWNYALTVCLLGFLGMLILYLRFGKGHQVDFNQKISSDLPHEEPPAFTSLFFFNKQVYGAAMTATLLDLARRGYLAIEQTTLPEKKWWGTKPPQFTFIQKSPEQIKKALVEEAIKLHAEEVEATSKLSEFGSELINDGSSILTHCNAGPLATTGYGTALGAIIRAKEQGKKIRVFADETRPLLQGARLTTWELKRVHIPVTLITDSMAGYFINQGKVSCVIVGADRIATNGDTANKIGTYSVAVLAKENYVPFYVAAPTSTIDASLASGVEIPIEQRRPEEITHIQGVSIAPNGIGVSNPSFDVTPHRYITAIITERGIIREPYREGIKKLF